MIPVNLSIKGFLSYKEEVNINFEELHLASITGANGAGKSSILDAITWALFGQARAKSDQIINQQSNLASVSLDFIYEKQLFRVRRTKPFEKPMLLEFYIRDLDSVEWRSITEHTITETQKKIEGTLRLNYDTFINASFFLQGKADQFTQLSPGDRKAILSTILGLEIWEEYQKKAKDIRRVFEIEQKKNESLLDEINKEIENEKQIEAFLKEIELDLERKQAEKQTHKLIMDQATQLEMAKTNAENQMITLKEEIRKLMEKLQKGSDRKKNLTAQIEMLTNQVMSAPKIEKDYQQWQLTRDQLELSTTKFEKYMQVKQKLEALVHKEEIEDSQLKSDFKNLEEKFIVHEKNVETLPEKENELNQSISLINELNSKISKKDHHNLRLKALQIDLTTHLQAVKHLTQLNDEKRAHLKEFKGAGPECPFCSQPLTEEHRQKYESLIIKEGLERKTLIEKENKVIDDLRNQIQDVDHKIKEIEALEKESLQVQNSINQKQLIVNTINDQILDWEKNKANVFKTLRQQLATNSHLEKFKAEKEALQVEINQINFDENQHTQLKLQESNLRGVEDKYRQMESAKNRLEPLNQQILELSEDIRSDEVDYQRKLTTLSAIETDFEKQFSHLAEISDLQKELDDIDKEINQITRRLGAEKQKLDTIGRKKKDKLILQEKLAQLTLQVSRYQKLEEAFGKNGVPALLIEQALPEIETHANEILERLTSGQFSIHFETQSEYKDKKRQDKKETLDILINDANGHTRAYEMFSGGEAFRINFSVRLALSRVLAKRSGARLQTLVVDEGFGSQDIAGRNRLVETINLIKSDFSKILIITHLEDLKDAFPGRIEVEKTSMGSQVEVVVY